MDMHIYRKFLNACQLSGTKKIGKVKYPFRKIDVYAVKIYRNNAYGNGTGNMSAGRAGQVYRTWAADGNVQNRRQDGNREKPIFCRRF